MRGTAYPGPDWSDVAILARGMEQATSGTVRVELTYGASRYDSVTDVLVVVSIPKLVGPGKLERREALGVFPCNGHATIEGLVYRLLLSLDKELMVNGTQLPLDLK